MLDLNLPELRDLASLNSVKGYRGVLLKVLKSDQEDALTKLKLAHGQEAIVEAALLFRVWDDVMKKLEAYPRDAEAALKAQGDAIYG